MIEMQERILPLEDEEISSELEKSFKSSGIKIFTGSKVQEIEKLKTKIKVKIKTTSDELSIDTDLVLLAIGVEGNIKILGLKKLE